MRVGLGLGLGSVRQLSSLASAASSCQICEIGVFRRLLHVVSRAIGRHLGLFRRVCLHTHIPAHSQESVPAYGVCGMRHVVFGIGLVCMLHLTYRSSLLTCGAAGPPARRPRSFFGGGACSCARFFLTCGAASGRPGTLLTCGADAKRDPEGVALSQASFDGF